MNKILLITFLFLSITGVVKAQELNCEVVINAEQTGKSNLPVFRTLQRSVMEFMNQTTWTSKDVQNFERINCSIFINILSLDNDNFTATVQVQSSRPVYGSSLITPVFNFNDEQFTFTYREYEPLNYSQNSYTSNLVSVLSFYAYTILGLDADTFVLNGGLPYFEEANRVVNTAQQGNSIGWKGADGNRSRYRLNADLLSNTFEGYHQAMYEYHRLGLDLMHKDAAVGKKMITNSILTLNEMNDTRPNSFLMRVFLDAKAQEIEQLFNGGPQVSITQMVDALNKMAPMYSENWRNIQF